MITKKEFSQALTDNASVAAGLGRLASKSLNCIYENHIYKISFGFSLTNNDIVHIYHEPNGNVSYHITVMSCHAGNNLSISCSADHLGVRRINIYWKEGDNSSLFIVPNQWSLTSAFATSSRDISNLWNPTFTDVTDTISLDDLKHIW